MRLYGVRGATTVENNDSESILLETQKLLKELILANNIKRENVVSIIFTSTVDLNAEFPAKACRMMGWDDIPLLGAVEADIPHGVPRCIRVLIHVYLETGSQVRPVYLNKAVRLRPDLVEGEVSR